MATQETYKQAERLTLSDEPVERQGVNSGQNTSIPSCFRTSHSFFLAWQNPSTRYPLVLLNPFCCWPVPRQILRPQSSLMELDARCYGSCGAVDGVSRQALGPKLCRRAIASKEKDPALGLNLSCQTAQAAGKLQRRIPCTYFTRQVMTAGPLGFETFEK